MTENQRDVDGMGEPKGKYLGGLRGNFSVFVENFGKNWAKSAMKLEKIKIRGWELTRNFEGA